MDLELPELGGLFLRKVPTLPNNTYTKHTVLHSPLIRQIYPHFKVSLSKPIHGLSSTFVNDENDQTLHAPEQDSYFSDDMNEDDDLAWDLPENGGVLPPQKLESPPAESDFASVKVLVKATSLAVNGVEFPLNSGVRASVAVRGNAGAEHSLLVSIQSGFLLLIRIWRVPRDYGDASFGDTRQGGPETTTSHFYKPFVVQWWKTAAENSAEMSGGQLSAHQSGLAVVSASPASVFRVYMCQTTDFGMQLLPHVNVPVNGVILHSCFSTPLKDVGDNHLMFLVLTFSNLRRLDLTLYNWYVSDSLTDNLVKSTLPLNSMFPIPIMIVPLAKNHSFLLVCRDMFIVVTVHNITSADYSFSRFAYDDSFPTSYYLPELAFSIPEKEKTDEVLLAAESGTIFSVVVTDNTALTYTAVAQVADAISVFTFEKEDNGYRLNYASDTGGSKELLIASLFSETTEKKLPYSSAELVEDYKNWAPVVDILVVDSLQLRHKAPYCSQEVWALTGIGKRTKLTQLRQGYSVRKETKPVSSFRKTECLFHLSLYDRNFLLCSMPLATKLLEVMDVQTSSGDQPEENDLFVELETAALLTDETTLHVAVIPNTSTIVQFTPTRVGFSNLEHLSVAEVSPRRILHVDVASDIAAVVMEHGLAISLELFQLSETKETNAEVTSEFGGFCGLATAELNCEVSALSVHADTTTGKVLIFVGNFDGNLSVLEYYRDESLCEVSYIDLCDLNPYEQSNSLIEDHVIPHQIAFLPSAGKIYVGSSAGHLIQLQIRAGANLEMMQFLRLGYTPVTLQLCKTDPNLLLVCSRNLWLFNFYTSPLPVQVAFEEKNERSVLRAVELPSNQDQRLRFAFTREDGLILGSLFCHKVPLIKQISVGDTAKRVCFLDSMNLFAVLCKSKDALTRLRFADRKTSKMLATVEVDSKSGMQRKDAIFGAGEMPVCGFVWHIQRLDRVSKKLIVGTSINNSSGSVKILDVTKISIEGEDTPVVKVVELITFNRDEPVSCIEQIDSTIFFASGCSIYSTSYSFDDKKLRPVKTLTSLESEVISLSVDDNNVLLVNTRRDSLIAFNYDNLDDEDTDMDNQDSDSDGSRHESLKVFYKDPISRSLVNHAKIGSKLIAGDKLHSSLVVVDSSDRASMRSFTYKMSMIPRIYVSKFSGLWASEEDRKRILGVGVNGELTIFDHINDKGKEVVMLEEQLKSKLNFPLDFKYEGLVERLNRPFADKVTGKGFQSIYKPYFDFAGNTDKLIDYELEGLSTVQISNVLI